VQEIGAPQRFGNHRVFGAMFAKFGRCQIIAFGQRPSRESRLLRVEEVGVGQVRQIFAVVAPGILPPSPDVDEAVAAMDADIAIGGVGVTTEPEVIDQRLPGDDRPPPSGPLGLLVH